MFKYKNHTSLSISKLRTLSSNSGDSLIIYGDGCEITG